MRRPNCFRRRDVEALTTASRAAFDRIRPLLQARGTQGLVRRGHGDLHLGNIALIEGRPVPFDAIEFDPLIAAGDVLYDLAFLLMDLTGRGLTQAANVVLNRYLAEARRDSDLDALAALPLFMCLRAAIRAKVTAARLESAKAGERAAIMEAATDLFPSRLRPDHPARAEADRGRRTIRHGQVGAGARARRRLLPAPGAVLLRSDVERKVLFGVPKPSGCRRKPTLRRRRGRFMRRSPTRRGASSRPAIRRSSMRCFAAPEERAAIAAMAGGVRFAACFSWPISQRGSNASARAETMRPMPMLASPQQQETYDLGAMEWSTGRRVRHAGRYAAACPGCAAR